MQYRFTRSWMYFHELSTESGRPFRPLLERVAARPGAEAGPERDRDQEREQAEEEGDALVLPALAAGQQRDQDRAEHRKEDHQGEEMGLDEAHLSSSPGRRKAERRPRAQSPRRTAARRRSGTCAPWQRPRRSGPGCR